MPTESKDTKPGGIQFYGGYEVYSESGIDLTLLRQNLRRPVEVLMENNNQAVKFVDEVQSSSSVAAVAERCKSRKLWMFDAEAAIKHLCACKVEFVVIGGIAMIAQGSAHITTDLDICYARTPENIAKTAAAFAGIHPYLRGAPPGLPFRFDAPTIAAGLNFTLITDFGDIDLLGEVTGVGSYSSVLAQSLEKTMYGLTVRVLSVDGLIAAKNAAGRTKDRLHLLELEELKKMLESKQKDLQKVTEEMEK